MTGLEPVLRPWKGLVQPLHHTRRNPILALLIQIPQRLVPSCLCSTGNGAFASDTKCSPGVGDLLSERAVPG